MIYITVYGGFCGMAEIGLFIVNIDPFMIKMTIMFFLKNQIISN